MVEFPLPNRSQGGGEAQLGRDSAQLVTLGTKKDPPPDVKAQEKVTSTIVLVPGTTVTVTSLTGTNKLCLGQAQLSYG